MIARLLISGLAAALALGSPAYAGEGPAAAREGAGNIHMSGYKLPNDLTMEAEEIENAFAPPDAAYVDLPSMNIPVVRGERLVAYAFVMVRLHLRDERDEWRVRDESHYLLDAAVRRAHHVPFQLVQGERYDDSATRAALLETIHEVVGSDLVERVELLGGDIRLISG